MLRKIIEIDEERCNGCGQCVLDCAEGAIAIVDGKAKVIADHFCDGLGACLQGCPQDALHIVEREADPFDPAAVEAHLHAKGMPAAPHASSLPGAALPPLACGCPGSAARSFAEGPAGGGHWPVKLRLVPAHAPFLDNAHLLLAADCAPAVFPGFHTLAQGKVVLTLCPKFEDNAAMLQKLADICANRHPQSLTALRMEVPCCKGLESMAREAVRQAGSACPLTVFTAACSGKTLTI